MAITIKELLASDTISQAADKINFNFDQLLLNGGGPQGPQGPQGPPGPIGGRGIRGSVWYEGTADPTVTPPTATPEDEDNYLQSNGDVWTYDVAIPGWVNTGINLQGPTGPAGSGGKFAEYQAVSTYGPAGDTTIFPDEMSLASSTVVNQGVRSVLIGGFPASPAFAPTTTGTNIVPQSIATSLEKGSYTMMLHQFDANDTALVFHGGDATQKFSQAAITDLSYIKLEADDALRIVAPKQRSSGAATEGIYVEATNRAIDLKAGREMTIRTGTAMTSDNYAGKDNFQVVVSSSPGGTAEPYASIFASEVGQQAEIKIGQTSALPISTLYQGNVLAQGGKISLIGSGAMNMITSTTINMNAGTDIDINAGSTIDMIGAGLVTVRSTGNDLRLWAYTLVDVFSGDDVDVHAKDGDVHIFTDTGTGGDVLIDTNNTGSQIKLETTSNTSPIELITNGANSDIKLETTGSSAPIEFITNTVDSPIVLDANNGGAIPANIGQSGLFAYSLLRSQGNFYIGAGTGSYSFPGFFPSGNKIVLDAQDDVILQAVNDIILNTTSGGSNIQIQAPTGVAPTTINGTNVKVNGSNHIAHSTQLTTQLDVNIMMSGVYTANALVGASSIVASSWIRIGNVVTFSGFGTCVPGSALTFNLPIVKSGGLCIGGGTASTKNSSTPPSLSVCTVGCLGTTFSISDANGIVSPGPNDDSFTFSFTYTIT